MIYIHAVRNRIKKINISFDNCGDCPHSHWVESDPDYDIDNGGYICGDVFKVLCDNTVDIYTVLIPSWCRLERA